MGELHKLPTSKSKMIPFVIRNVIFWQHQNGERYQIESDRSKWKIGTCTQILKQINKYYGNYNHTYMLGCRAHNSTFGKAVLYLKEKEVSKHCNHNNSKHIFLLVEEAQAQSLNKTYSV